MKQKDLIKLLKKAGFDLQRHGSNHDVYKRGTDTESIPRHREIKEALANSIIRKWNL